MRYLTFIIIFFLISASASHAQDPKMTEPEIIRPGDVNNKTDRIKHSDMDSILRTSWKEYKKNDSTIEKIKRIKRVPVTIGKSNKMGLDNLLGLSRDDAFPIIKKYDYRIFTEHEPYPYIREVFEITNVTRWNYPTKLYIFVDSSMQICRMNYFLGVPEGMTPESAHAITENLHRDHHDLDTLSENGWEMAGWMNKDKSGIYTWQKNLPKTKPAYILTTTLYSEHLSKSRFPTDGIFTPVKQ